MTTLLESDAPICSIVIPAKNESGSIGAVVAAVPTSLHAEVIVVDNNSTDATSDVARTAGAVVVRETTPGYGHACYAGVASATASQVIVFIDGDGSMDPGDIPALIQPILDGTADIVCGSRTKRAEKGSLPPQQRMGNWLSVVILRVLFGVHLSELGPYRAINANLLRDLDLKGSRYAWVAELLARGARAGSRIIEVDVSYKERTAGKSKVSGTLRGTLGAGSAIIGTLLWRRVSPDRAARSIRQSTTSTQIRTTARVLIGTGALLPVSNYIWVALHRIGSPFELEWFEGGAVELINRTTHGLGLYTAPSLSNVPWPYTPLYFWISAGVSKVIGVGFLAPRLVSFASSIGILLLLALIIRRETKSWSGGLVAAGLYAAAYRESGDWYDLARVDSLFILLTLAALYIGRRAFTTRAGVLFGIVSFLAFFTKQDALIAIAPAMLFLLAKRPKVGASAIATLTGFLVGSTVVMNAFSHGWYGYYVFNELRTQHFMTHNVLSFWTRDIWRLDAPVAAIGLLVIVLLVTKMRRTEKLDDSFYWLAAAIGLLGASWIGHQHSGAYLDVFMPGFAALAIGGGLAWGWSSAARDTAAKSKVAGRNRSSLNAIGSMLLPAVIAAALIVQVHEWKYSLQRQIPTAGSVTAGNNLLDSLRSLPSPLAVLDHPWYASELHKGTTGQEEAIQDILRAGPSRARSELQQNLTSELSHFRAIVIDNGGDEKGISQILNADFVEEPLQWSDRDAFGELSDLDLRPKLLFIRKDVVNK